MEGELDALVEEIRVALDLVIIILRKLTQCLVLDPIECAISYLLGAEVVYLKSKFEIYLIKK